MDYLYALADHYLKSGQMEAAEGIAEQMVEKHPDHPLGHQIQRFIKREINRASKP